MSSSGIVCGTGNWTGPKPGDPDNNLILTAVPAFGGIDVVWSFPGTNPHAVAHTILYRSTSPNLNSATQISIVSGNFYYDKLSIPVTYYYWIRVVSVNGTTGDWIGPASAIPRKLIDDLIKELTGKIDAGVLAESLRQEIAKIPLSYTELDKEINARLAQNSALSAALALIDARANTVEVFVQNEITKRIDGDNALVNQLQLIAAANANNTALITNEKTVRVTADEALARDVNALYVRTNTNAAAVLQETQTRTTADSALASDISSLVAKTDATNGLIDTERSLRISGDAAVATIANSARVSAENAAAATSDLATSKIGYSALAGGAGTPYDGDGSTEIYPASVFPANTFPEYAVNRKRIIDKVGVTRWNATAAGAAKPLVWVAGMPLATAIKQVEVTGPNGEIATVEQSMTAQRDLNNKLKAQYTAKVSVNGLVGGFGVYNDGNVVEAGFDVDSFWVGRTDADKKKPFIIENNEVFIDDAAINKLTFSKLRDESGSFIVQNGKVKANYIDTNGLVIRDQWGNPIFGAGTALSTAYITGLGSLATQNSVAYSSVTGAKPPTNADNTASNTAAAIANQGTLATRNGVSIGTHVTFPDGSLMNTTDFVNRLSKINDTNISTFMSSAAIGNAYIGNAAISSAKIGIGEVDTLRIQGSAVIVAASAVVSDIVSTELTVPFSINGLEAGELAPIHIHVGIVASETMVSTYVNSTMVANDRVYTGHKSYIGAAAMLGNGVHSAKVVLENPVVSNRRLSLLVQVCKR